MTLDRSFRWLLLVAAGVALIYAPSLGSPLFFDDELLTSGELFRLHQSLGLRERALSYGSFVWVKALAGEAWWVQRMVNILLHLAVVVALYGFYRDLLRRIEFSPQPGTGVATRPEDSPALAIAVGFYALNPVAVYAVAYLIQRSIVMATLFVVLALWCFTRGLVSRRVAWFAGALASYLLAVASKEYAVFAPLAAIPVFIIVCRPSTRRLAALIAGALALGALVAGLVILRYGHLIGKPFDEYSLIYLRQLSQLSADVQAQAWPLSILNQSYLFFEYGMRWMLPWSGGMSVDLRPPFPVSFLSLPQALGPIGYVTLIGAGAFLLLRYRDGRALLGVCLLLPALLYPTEFATVWVQDPFVLYRSYLWGIGIPGVVFLLLHGFSGRVLAGISVVLATLLAWQSLDRVFSMSTPERLYSDAIAKVPNDPRSVGRWFPYLNRGNIYFDAKQYQLAERDFRASAALGDGGQGIFNVGSLRLREGDANAALRHFDDAERQGYTGFNVTMQRGNALAALGKPADAYAQLQAAMAMNPTAEARTLMTQQMGRLAFQLGRHDEAIAHAKAILGEDKRNREAGYLMATSLIAKREFDTAARLLSIMIAEAPAGGLHLSRAMALFGLQQKAAAKADIEAALRLGLDNPAVRDWQKKIEAMP